MIPSSEGSTIAANSRVPRARISALPSIHRRKHYDDQVKSALDPVHNLLLGREDKDVRCNPHLARPAVAYKGLSEVST